MWRGEPQRLAAVVLQKVDGFGGVGVGFWPGLAGFVDHRRAEQMLLRAHARGGLEEHTCALVGRPARPFSKSTPCSFEGALCLSLVRARDAADALPFLA